MTYDPKWRREDERRMEWLDKLYRLDGRQHDCHPSHGLFTGLVAKWGAMPWKADTEYLPAGKRWRHQGS